MHKRWRNVLPRRLWLWLIDRELRREFTDEIKAAKLAGDQIRVLNSKRGPVLLLMPIASTWTYTRMVSTCEPA